VAATQQNYLSVRLQLCSQTAQRIQHPSATAVANHMTRFQALLWYTRVIAREECTRHTLLNYKFACLLCSIWSPWGFESLCGDIPDVNVYTRRHRRFPTAWARRQGTVLTNLSVSLRWTDILTAIGPGSCQHEVAQIKQAYTWGLNSARVFPFQTRQLARVVGQLKQIGSLRCSTAVLF
jgi:hypothetical protein